MKAWLWRLALLFFGASAGVLLLLRWVWDYFAVYENVGFYCTGPIMALAVVPLALVGLGIVWIVALATGHHRIKISLLVLGCVLLWAINPYLPPSASVAQGFRDRYGARSPDDLRELALAIDGAMRQDDGTREDARKFAPPDSKVVLDGKSKLQLQQRFPFLRWMGGAEYIAEKNHVVEIWWGGALEGHWGALVDLRGQAVENPMPRYCRLYPIAPDVVFIDDRS